MRIYAMAEIRLLIPSDIPAVMRLNRAANWNQLEQDWQRILQLEPEGCFGLECDGRIVATATAICYGTRLAWIGMVLTDPEYRRRGFGRLLTERAIRYAEQRQVDWIKLDATDLGRPIYLQLGFVDESPIERWTGVGPGGRFTAQARPFTLDAVLDLASFGADRKQLLASLASDSVVSSRTGGCAMARPGANAFSLGPCIARTATEARELIACVLSEHSGQPFYWDLLPANKAAVRLAEEFGFVPARKLARMVRPGNQPAEPLKNDDSLVYAAAGFEYG